MKEVIRIISNEFLEEYMPLCNAAMVTGSACKDSMPDKADIDIVVLDDNITADYFESISFKGYKIDCIILPTVNISEMLINECDTGRIIYINMLSMGVVVKDTNNKLKELQLFAIDLRDRGPKPISIRRRKTLLFQTYNLYDDLLDDREWNEILFIATEMFSMISTINNSFNSHWITTGKWKYRYLQEFDADFTSNLVNSYVKLVSKKDKTDFVNFVYKNLLSYGDQPKQFTSRLYQFVIENGMLTISVSTEVDVSKTYEILLKELEVVLKIYNDSIDLFYIYNDGNIEDRSRFLIFIQGENDILNDVILPVINKFLMSNNKLVANEVKCLPNYHIGAGFLFDNQCTYELAKPILFELNKFYKKLGGYNENKALTYLTQFHLALGSKLNLSIEEYIAFNRYLSYKWGALAIDMNKESSFKGLSDKKVLIEKEYTTLFEQQKNSLLVNYSIIYDNWGRETSLSVDTYVEDLLEMMKQAYMKLTTSYYLELYIPKFKIISIDYPISDLQKKRWITLESLLGVIYSSVLLSSNHKYYLSFASSSLLELLDMKTGVDEK